jgi:hypothetical protein
MSRSALFAVCFGVLALAEAVRGQPAIRLQDEPIPKPSPLDAKELAKAKFEVAHADRSSLLWQKVEVAWLDFNWRLQGYHAGRATLDILLESHARWVQSEQELAGKEADRLPYLNAIWLQRKSAHDSNKLRYDTGHLGLGDYMESTYLLLEAQLWLAEAGAGRRQDRLGDRPMWARGPVLVGGDDSDWIPGDLQQAQEVARWKAQLLEELADRTWLLRAKREAADVVYDARMREFSTGRGMLHSLLEAAQRLLESERAVSNNAAGQVTALKRNWVRLSQIEHLIRQRYESGQVNVLDYTHSRYARLDAEIRLIAASAPSGGRSTSAGPAEVEGRGPLGAKETAKGMRDALGADPDVVGGARLQAVRLEWEAGEQQFLAGRPALDFLLDSSNRLLDAELALREKAPHRLAALERYWERLWKIEVVNRLGYEANRVAIPDYTQSRHARLDAELRWLEARAGRAKK